jgi:hypothetical protein
MTPFVEHWTGKAVHVGVDGGVSLARKEEKVAPKNSPDLVQKKLSRLEKVTMEGFNYLDLLLIPQLIRPL